MVEFTRESILQAIELIDAHPELRKGRASIEYDLIHDSKTYPPILVLSEASKLLGGTELLLSDFGNSTKQPFSILQNLGFTVARREAGFYNQLEKFLKQASQNDLKTSEYTRTFRGLQVKVSFGQGTPARVPWIAFLDNRNSVSDGIYPVYLFYKSKNLLILAYGVSETNKPAYNWPISNEVTIANYFSHNGLAQPDRYGNSYVFATYDTAQPLNEEKVNSDIDQLVNIYKALSFENAAKVNAQPQPMPQAKQQTGTFDYKAFVEKVYEAGLVFNQRLCLRLTAALLTKPFVILTGLSGSGKTKIAQAFASWLCENEKQYCIVPVGADWTNREPLLGFPNALKSNEYVKPDNRVLDTIIEANENPSKPYFIILDEMNLSHVERYFADFLSVMESNSKIALHSGDDSWNVPPELGFPKNLFIIGTVNIDETTYMFSPKVLDRANVIEFRVTESDMTLYLQDPAPVNLQALCGAGANMAPDFLELAKNPRFSFVLNDEVRQTLTSFFVQLKEIGAEFGYRTASEILRFAGLMTQLETNCTLNQVIDAAVMQKLLPKIHGSRRKLEPMLKTMGKLCLVNGGSVTEYLDRRISQPEPDGTNIKFPLSLDKITRMYQNLLSNSFTSFAEA